MKKKRVMKHGISRLVEERAHRKPVMNVLYDFRFNTVIKAGRNTGLRVLGLVPARYKIRPEHFQAQGELEPVTADIATSTKQHIRMILESDFARKAHPYRSISTPALLLNPAEHGHIGRLLNTVQVANPGKWEEYFTNGLSVW